MILLQMGQHLGRDKVIKIRLLVRILTWNIVTNVICVGADFLSSLKGIFLRIYTYMIFTLTHPHVCKQLIMAYYINLHSLHTYQSVFKIRFDHTHSLSHQSIYSHSHTHTHTHIYVCTNIGRLTLSLSHTHMCKRSHTHTILALSY